MARPPPAWSLGLSLLVLLPLPVLRFGSRQSQHSSWPRAAHWRTGASLILARRHPLACQWGSVNCGSRRGPDRDKPGCGGSPCRVVRPGEQRTPAALDCSIGCVLDVGTYRLDRDAEQGPDFAQRGLSGFIASPSCSCFSPFPGLSQHVRFALLCPEHSTKAQGSPKHGLRLCDEAGYTVRIRTDPCTEYEGTSRPLRPGSQRSTTEALSQTPSSVTLASNTRGPLGG
jgi:hypothetical protein